LFDEKPLVRLKMNLKKDLDLFEKMESPKKNGVKIEEWFDPKNLEHLKAFRALQDTGQWPVGFIPKGTEFTVGWHVKLGFMLANEYLKEKLGG